jgi:hypothetical protein
MDQYLTGTREDTMKFFATDVEAKADTFHSANGSMALTLHGQRYQIVLGQRERKTNNNDQSVLSASSHQNDSEQEDWIRKSGSARTNQRTYLVYSGLLRPRVYSQREKQCQKTNFGTLQLLWTFIQQERR